MKLSVIVGLTTILLIVMINLFVTLVIFLAEDEHVPDYVKIYELFQSPSYQKIRNKLMKHNYTILIGDDETGVKNFIEHQANIHTTEGRPVVIKRYHSISKQKQKILKTIKQTRFYMEFVLGLGRQQRTEVFFVKTIDELPLEEIKFIREKYPSDNIIIVCQKKLPIKISGFNTIVFPEVKIKQLKQVIKLYYHLSDKEVDKVIRQNQNSIEMTFDYFKRKSKLEGGNVEEIVQVEDIQELNEISQELTEKKLKKLKKNNSKETKLKRTNRKDAQASKR